MLFHPINRYFIYPAIILLICLSACTSEKRLISARTAPLSVTVLNLSNKRLDSLPEGIDQMTNLQELVFFRNRFTVLPPEIGKLPKLEELSFQSNQLVTVAHELGNLNRLRKLNLRFNMLKELPETLGELKELEELDLRNNNLVKLPESMGDLSKLEYLYLSDNNLELLPESMRKLYNLRLLHIGKNDIRGALPDFIGNLESLIELDVSGCCADINLPYTLANLKKLELLIISPYQVLPYNVGSQNSRLRVVVR